MLTNDFYQEIAHVPVPWKQYQLHSPLFYQDIMFMAVSILAPLPKINSLLPSKRLKPFRISPWNSVISIQAYEYSACDIEPYNELAISIPVTIDEEAPLFTGILRKMPKKPLSYILHLPVTTEIARAAGAELAGYPKFLASIDFVEEGNWVTCELKADDQNVLTISGRKLELRRAHRFLANPITYRNGYMLRSEFILSDREMGSSRSKDDVDIKLGNHPISEELRGLKLGRVLEYAYCPHAQGILTSVLESFKG
jgi:Acetoacetate decarboxylase (ADC)